MTSRHHAILRQPEGQTTEARPPTGDSHPCHDDGNMAQAIVAAITQEAQSEYGSDIDFHSLPALSDYGSDIDIDEDTLIGDLLVKLAASAPQEVAYPSIENDEQDEAVVGDPRHPPLVVHWEERAAQSSPVAARSVTMEIEYDAPSRRAFSVPREDSPAHFRPTPEPSPITHDARTPLERYKKRNPLSVSDLVSPAWCELQFFYNLSKYGRKPRTDAMKTGSRIHQALEDEVSVSVQVETVSKEDRFGLKIWNTIQGLRTLRETGLTRELWVCGIVEGQVINGVIDELSFACPDPELEEKLEVSKAQQSGGTLPLGQLSIEQPLRKAGGATSRLQDTSANAFLGGLEADRQVYISDVKTRGLRNLPPESQVRQARLQLMLYRKLLASLSLNTVDAETIFARYSLTPLKPFSEAFIRGIDGLGADDTDFDSENPDTILRANELRLHSNLLAIWSLMISKFQQTIPAISDILRAEYRYARTGEVIGNKLTVYDAEAIDTHIKEEMDLWKGGREAKGVEIEEAFKCQRCDFAEECTWRKTKIEEATEKHRLRKETREKSAV